MDRVLLEPYVAPMEMGGRVMRGFVRVSPDGYRTEAALKKWIERGMTAAASRPVKKARRKAKKKA